MLVRNLKPGLVCIGDLEDKKHIAHYYRHVRIDMMPLLFVLVFNQTLNRRRFSVCISAEKINSLMSSPNRDGASILVSLASISTAKQMIYMKSWRATVLQSLAKTQIKHLKQIIKVLQDSLETKFQAGVLRQAGVKLYMVKYRLLQWKEDL